METPGIEFIEPQKFGDCPLISTGPKSTEHTELVITVTFSSPVNGDGSTAYQVERLAFNLNGNIAACDREALSRSIQKSYEELAATTSVTSRVGERIRGGSSSVLVQFGQTSTLSAGAPSDQRQPGRTTSSSAKVHSPKETKAQDMTPQQPPKQPEHPCISLSGSAAVKREIANTNPHLVPDTKRQAKAKILQSVAKMSTSWPTAMKTARLYGQTPGKTTKGRKQDRSDPRERS